MHRFIRRFAIAAVVVLAGFVAADQWSAPAGEWACESNAACVQTVALDLEAAGAEDGWVGWKAFDLSPDGSQVVVGLQSVNKPGDSENLLVGTFSTETGELLATLVRADMVEFASTDEVTFSPDGTLIAAVTYDSGGRLQIFDATSGDAVATIIENDDSQVIGCSGRLGISPANDLVQCRSALFDIASGTALGALENRPPYASSRGGSFAWSASGIVADGYRSDGINIRGSDPASPVQAEIILDRLPNRDRSLISFAETVDGDEQLIVTEDARPWQFWSREPRRSHPGARISAFSVTTGTMQWSMDVADRTADLAANGQGLVATISDDAVVMVFEVG